MEQTFEQKIVESIGHYRKALVPMLAKTFDEDELNKNMDDVLVRAMEIFFEQEGCDDFKELLLESARDCEVKEL